MAHEAAGVRRDVFRRGQVDVAPLDVARAAGIRLRRQPRARDRRHPLDRLEHRRRADAAVDADDVGVRLERRRELLGRRAVEAVAVFLDRHLRHDRQVADAADRGDGGAHLVQVAERFEHEEIDAAGEQRLGLFAEVGLGLVASGLAPRLDADAQRADRAGDVRLPAGRRLGQLRPFEVDVAQPVGQAEAAQLDAVGAERVRLDDIRAGADVVLVHLGDLARLGQVQRVEAAVDEDALRIEHRPHGAVAHEHALVDGFEKWLHSERNHDVVVSRPLSHP